MSCFKTCFSKKQVAELAKRVIRLFSSRIPCGDEKSRSRQTCPQLCASFFGIKNRSRSLRSELPRAQRSNYTILFILLSSTIFTPPASRRQASPPAVPTSSNAAVPPRSALLSPAASSPLSNSPAYSAASTLSAARFRLASLSLIRVS